MRRFLSGALLALLACGGTTTDVGDAGDSGVPVKDAGNPDAPGQPPPPVDGGPPTTETMTRAVPTIRSRMPA